MPVLSAADSVSPAMERAKAMLLPFRFKTWLKLGFIGWLAGELGSASLNFQNPNFQGLTLPHSTTSSSPHPFPGIHMPNQMIVTLLVCAAVLLLAFMILFTFLFSRFRFVLFDCVVTRDVAIGRGWHKYRAQGSNYFVFWLLVSLAGLLSFAAVVGIPIWRAWRSGVFDHLGDDPSQIFVFIGSIFLGIILLALVYFVVLTLTKDFLVPFMALDNLTVGEAWSVLKTMLKAEPVAFLAYLGLKFVLLIAGTIMLAIVLAMAIFILLIPFVIVGVIIAAAAHAAMSIPVLIALGILAGLIFGTLFAILGLVACAPLTAFFGSYSLYFLGGRYPKLGMLLWPPPAAAPAPLPV